MIARSLLWHLVLLSLAACGVRSHAAPGAATTTTTTMSTPSSPAPAPAADRLAPAAATAALHTATFALG